MKKYIKPEIKIQDVYIRNFIQTLSSRTDTNYIKTRGTYSTNDGDNGTSNDIWSNGNDDLKW